jgi:hypothetical protein
MEDALEHGLLQDSEWVSEYNRRFDNEFLLPLVM